MKNKIDRFKFSRGRSGERISNLISSSLMNVYRSFEFDLQIHSRSMSGSMEKRILNIVSYYHILSRNMRLAKNT